MITLRRIVKKPLRRIEFEVKSRIALLLRIAFLKVKPQIYVTFDTSKSVDGTGAQLQRQATVMALAKYFDFTFINSDFKQVSVHPLDPFQSEREYAKYLERLSKFLKADGSSSSPAEIPPPVSMQVTFRSLILECLMQALRGKRRNFLIFEPYPVTEFCPGIMDGLKLQSNENFEQELSKEVCKLIIHYRQGVGGFALYPGQNIPREIPLNKFVSRAQTIARELPSHIVLQITVMTDAPEIETVFTPPATQLSLWEGTPGFSNGVMTIKPTKFDELERLSKFPLRVLRGGNPLDTILEMASANVLLIGKSSLSYTAGLLNRQGQIYYPKDFWHKPLMNWKEL